MTTFIIAVRGTVAQAMLLGARGDFLIIAIAPWVFARTWREQLRLRGQVVSMRIIITMATITHRRTPMSWPMPTRSGAGSPLEL